MTEPPTHPSPVAARASLDATNLYRIVNDLMPTDLGVYIVDLRSTSPAMSYHRIVREIQAITGIYVTAATVRNWHLRLTKGAPE